ncbi:hypothetical protein [Undibacterium sp. TS12]|uniref:hypothetical protein n=1 Tax=Undibacterium sp. TS12 TaxID=2908202 RepID=UPI001F4CF3BA|nr:hypothetical protein [Undibacterium sp. TS12]MCH8619560.1 hypothetical protein [Undibacterium sp. TS12]
MPYIGVGLHVLVALFFAIHAVRHGRELYWLMILFLFPLLGSVVYFFAVFLPSTRIEHGVRKTMHAAVKTLDPGRGLRDAQKEFDLVPTAQNQMVLAAAYLAAGDTAQAVHHYDICLQGPFAHAGDIRLGAANARLMHGQAAGAIDLLTALRQEQPAYQPEQVSLLLAQAYANAGRQQDAGEELAAATSRFGSMEIKAEYAIWALQAGQRDKADTAHAEIKQAMKYWNKHTKSLNRDLIKRLNSAFSGRA